VISNRHVRIGNPNQTAYAHHYQQLDADAMAHHNPRDTVGGSYTLDLTTI